MLIIAWLAEIPERGGKLPPLFSCFRAVTCNWLFMPKVAAEKEAMNSNEGAKLLNGYVRRMGWQTDIEQTVKGMGYELVEAERSTGGLLRVFIENPDGEPAITVDDCERVTRQLQYALEVQNVDYKRLEVSSPGLDRPLKFKNDYLRFAGERVEVTFKNSVTLRAADGSELYKQKHFFGTLQAAKNAGTDSWLLVLEPQADAGRKPGAKRSKKAVDEPVMGLHFLLDEVREARLAPMVDFKGKKGQVKQLGEGTVPEVLPDEKLSDENGRS